MMIHKTPSASPGNVRVVFELPACIWADRIYLVGDFNEWGTNAQPFMQGRDGVWRAILDLPAGRQYQFRYLVDGNWQTDYHADGWVENEYGSQNSIVSTALAEEQILHMESSLLHEGLTSLSHRSRRHTLSSVNQINAPSRQMMAVQ